MIKHGIALSDTHCGSKVGLTPPEWQIRPVSKSSTKRNKWYEIGRELWQRFDDNLKKLPKLDFVLVGGDLIDGKAPKSGATDLLTSDVQEQCDMSVAVFSHIRKYCKPDVKIIAVYGTDYHVATEGQDWESEIAHKSGFTKIGAHEWIDVNGVVFDIKHKIGSSQVPHGRYTAIARDQLWALLWAEREEQPRSNILLRAHAHYYSAIENSSGLAMILPALQGMGSRYGARQCSGTVDLSLIHI